MQAMMIKKYTSRIFSIKFYFFQTKLILFKMFNILNNLENSLREALSVNKSGAEYVIAKFKTGHNQSNNVHCPIKYLFCSSALKKNNWVLLVA